MSPDYVCKFCPLFNNTPDTVISNQLIVEALMQVHNYLDGKYHAVASKGNDVVKQLISSQGTKNDKEMQLLISCEEEIKKSLLTETYISYLLKMQLEGSEKRSEMLKTLSENLKSGSALQSATPFNSASSPSNHRMNGHKPSTFVEITSEDGTRCDFPKQKTPLKNGLGFIKIDSPNSTITLNGVTDNEECSSPNSESPINLPSAEALTYRIKTVSNTSSLLPLDLQKLKTESSAVVTSESCSSDDADLASVTEEVRKTVIKRSLVENNCIPRPKKTIFNCVMTPNGFVSSAPNSSVSHSLPTMVISPRNKDQNSALLSQLTDKSTVFLDSSTSYPVKYDIPINDDSASLKDFSRVFIRNQNLAGDSFKCRFCDSSFEKSRKLKEHVAQNHAGAETAEKPFTCGFCKKIFSEACYLKEHLNIHIGYRPFTCDICNKGFHNKDGLRQHKVIHLAVKPFSCGACGKQFAQRGQYARHKLKCTKQLHCGTCNKQFLHKNNLEKHLLVCSSNRLVKPEPNNSSDDNNMMPSPMMSQSNSSDDSSNIVVSAPITPMPQPCS